MKESDIEGVAIRSGPESCVGVREDDGEALTGVHIGWAIEPRNCIYLGCRRRSGRRKATLLAALCASRQRTPRGRKNLGMCGSLVRENREIP